MSNGRIGALCGPETETSELAYGKAVKALTEHKHVILIQFLTRRKQDGAGALLQRLEPELKLFRFEKTNKCCLSLTIGEKEEARLTVMNDLNFAKKVMATGECELLILDGILDILQHQIIAVDEFKQILNSPCEVELLLTGTGLPDGLKGCVRYVEQVVVTGTEG